MRTADRPSLVPFTSYQKLVIAILAFLQFTIILDFMIMSPLGVALMPALDITPAQFGSVVSAYAFSAGIAGLLAAGFADKFDRKKILLFFYVGFLVGTFLCAIATNFYFMLGARIVTGLFGGVIGSIVFAITTDLFPLSMRGRVMGFLQTAFAASQVLGIPVGLYLMTHLSWRAPFFMIVGVSLFVGVFIVVRLKPLDQHLHLNIDKSAIHHMIATLTNRRYLFTFASTALLSLGGFMLMPFASNFTVYNLGIDMEHLPLVYLVTGLASIFAGPLVGKAADRFGKLPTFIFGSIFGMVTVYVYTHMGQSALWAVMLINVVMFIAIFSRMIPAQALNSAIPDPASRGAFMSISSSMQQIAGGFASVVAGAIVVQRPDGLIEHFDTLGFILIGTSVIGIVMMSRINKMVKEIRHSESLPPGSLPSESLSH